MTNTVSLLCITTAELRVYCFVTSYFQTVSHNNSTYRASTKRFLLTTLENDLKWVAFAFFQFINKCLADRKYHLFYLLWPIDKKRTILREKTRWSRNTARKRGMHQVKIWSKMRFMKKSQFVRLFFLWNLLHQNTLPSGTSGVRELLAQSHYHSRKAQRFKY